MNHDRRKYRHHYAGEGDHDVTISVAEKDEQVTVFFEVRRDGATVGRRHLRKPLVSRLQAALMI